MTNDHTVNNFIWFQGVQSLRFFLFSLPRSYEYPFLFSFQF